MTINANRRTAMYVGVAALAAIAGAGVAWKRQSLDDMTPEAMSAFWAAEFDTPSGESLPMTAFQGKPLVINFWATKPVRRECVVRRSCNWTVGRCEREREHEKTNNVQK
jgi:hypothetical protein